MDGISICGSSKYYWHPWISETLWTDPRKFHLLIRILRSGRNTKNASRRPCLSLASTLQTTNLHTSRFAKDRTGVEDLLQYLLDKKIDQHYFCSSQVLHVQDARWRRFVGLHVCLEVLVKDKNIIIALLEILSILYNFLITALKWYQWKNLRWTMWLRIWCTRWRNAKKKFTMCGCCHGILRKPTSNSFPHQNPWLYLYCKKLGHIACFSYKKKNK